MVRLASHYSQEGIIVGGMIIQGTRENRVRTGFKITDLGSRNEAWLDHKNQLAGPRVGPYGMMIDYLETVGVRALEAAKETADLALID